MKHRISILAVLLAVCLLLAGCPKAVETPTEAQPQANLHIESVPSGAHIYLNDINTGERTPATLTVAPGSYDIRLTHGAMTWVRTGVKMVAGKTMAIMDASLAQLTGVPPMPDREYEAMAFTPPSFPPGATGALPTAADLSTYAPPVGNQGSQSSCTAWAVAYLKNIQEKRERGWSLDTPAHLMSPAFIYNQLNQGTDRGIYIHKALELTQAQGIAPLSIMPWHPLDYLTQPTPAVLSEAHQYRIAEWSRIPLHRTNGVIQRAEWMREFKLHLHNLTPLVIAIAVYSDIYLNDYNRVYDHDLGPNLGHHAVLVVGYDDRRAAFKFLNSWGAEYGENGYGWVSYALAQKVISQAYYAVDVVEAVKPEPPPEPPPPPPPPPPDSAPTFSPFISFHGIYEKDKEIRKKWLAPATGGDPPLRYRVENLPPGLRFNQNTRHVSGTPTRNGTYESIYWVTDSDGDSDSLKFRTVIWSPDSPPPQPIPVGKMYWTSITGRAGSAIEPRGTERHLIKRANVDGSQMEVLFNHGVPFQTAQIALHGDKMYLTGDLVARANHDGSGFEVLRSGSSSHAIAVHGDKVYWSDRVGDCCAYPNNTIKRANLDGTHIETLVTGLYTTLGIAISGGKMYWTDSYSSWSRAPPGGVIARSNLDGSGIEELIETTGQAPYGIAVHGGRIYWTDRVNWSAGGGGKILRSNLDGTGTKVLVDDLRQPLSLVVHNRRLYWITNHGMIQRANLDGTGVTTLVPHEGKGLFGRGLAIY